MHGNLLFPWCSASDKRGVGDLISSINSYSRAVRHLHERLFEIPIGINQFFLRAGCFFEMRRKSDPYPSQFEINLGLESRVKGRRRRTEEWHAFQGRKLFCCLFACLRFLFFFGAGHMPSITALARIDAGGPRGERARAKGALKRNPRWSGALWQLN